MRAAHIVLSRWSNPLAGWLKPDLPTDHEVTRGPDVNEDIETRSPDNSRGRPQSRESGIRASRRASSWTAVALIAGVAATTGYLAQSSASTTTTSATQANHVSTHHSGQSGSAQAPRVKGPVATSGGSGAAASAAGTASSNHAGQPGATQAPHVKSPVVTSGGSGATGGDN